MTTQSNILTGLMIYFTMVVCVKRCHKASRKVWCYVGCCMFTFIVIIPSLCYNIQFSAFDLLTRRNETELRDMLIRENHMRYKLSLDVLNQSESLLHHKLNFLPRLPLKFSSRHNSGEYNTMNPKAEQLSVVNGIAITIITVSRDEHLIDDQRTHYLLQSVAEFVKILNRTNLSFPVHLSVCNVDPHPDEHDDVNQLPTWLPVHNKGKTKTVMGYNDLLDKERMDYIFCMNESLKQNLSYVLLVEDDALPHSDLFSVLETHVLKNNWRYFSDLSSVLYIKLYHPERLLGYISLEIERIPELISLAVLCATVLTRIYTILQPRASISPIFAVLTLFCLCVLLSIGRSNIVNCRRVSRYLYQLTPAPSCCTPAMLFPRQSAITTSNYLQTIHCKKDFGKDIAMDKFVREHGHVTLYIQPNLFKHIGHYSSLRSKFINPFIVA